MAVLTAAIEEAERVMGHPLKQECVDPETGEIVPIVMVTDNGAAYKSSTFSYFVAPHPELKHVRTRHHSPETNGVIERFFGSLK